MQPLPQDTLSVLYCTDNHVGYFKNDKIRRNDSFRALEEVFQTALKYNVDCILFGGDLFHVSNPDQETQLKTYEIFKKYIFGSKPVTISAQSLTNPDVNIQLPCFMIHGNHDDISGPNFHSVIDILQSLHLVNYFGKATNLDDIKLNPIKIQKGMTTLCLYGLGYIRDERLHKAFLRGKVAAMAPKLGPSGQRTTFNMMMVHQNRHRHSQKGTNYLPKEFLAFPAIPKSPKSEKSESENDENTLSFSSQNDETLLDIILWGHEHDSKREPDIFKEMHIYQPGSAVPTSLSDGETLHKHMLFFQIHKLNYRVSHIPYRSCRPFVHRTVSLNLLEKTTAIQEIIRKIRKDLTLKHHQTLENDISVACDFESQSLNESDIDSDNDSDDSSENNLVHDLNFKLDEKELIFEIFSLIIEEMIQDALLKYSFETQSPLFPPDYIDLPRLRKYGPLGNVFQLGSFNQSPSELAVQAAKMQLEENPSFFPQWNTQLPLSSPQKKVKSSISGVDGLESVDEIQDKHTLPSLSTMLPVIRLKIQVPNDFEIYDPVAFRSQFIGKCANPQTLFVKYSSLNQQQRYNIDEHDDSSGLRPQNFEENSEQHSAFELPEKGRTDPIFSSLERMLKSKHLEILSIEEFLSPLQQSVETERRINPFSDIFDEKLQNLHSTVEKDVLESCFQSESKHKTSRSLLEKSNQELTTLIAQSYKRIHSLAHNPSDNSGQVIQEEEDLDPPLQTTFVQRVKSVKN